MRFALKLKGHQSMLTITQDIIDEIVNHSRREAPLEACGYLAAQNGIVCKCIAMKNIDGSPVHYAMDPAEQFAAVKNCREAGLTILGVYHSHPETAAYPSAEDIKLAYDPDLSYVIVSLAKETPDIQSYRIKKNEVFPEKIKLVGAKK